jgi:hypothetical protein
MRGLWDAVVEGDGGDVDRECLPKLRRRIMGDGLRSRLGNRSDTRELAELQQ